MNRLDSKHIHLLIDEPIYVLEEHFEHNSEDIKPIKVESPKFLGGNEKGVLIVFESAASLESEEDLEFLFKGLNALNYSLPDVALIDKSITNNTENIPHKISLTFLGEAGYIGDYIPVNENDTTILNCHKLGIIRADQSLKRKFWEGLKLLLKE